MSCPAASTFAALPTSSNTVLGCLGNPVAFQERREQYCRIVILQVCARTNAYKNPGGSLLIWDLPGQCPILPLLLSNAR